MDKNESSEINKRELDFRVFMAETVIYRTEQAKRMDQLIGDIKNLAEKVSLLPCRERMSFYSGVYSHIKLIWTFVSAIVVSLIASFYGHINGK